MAQFIFFASPFFCTVIEIQQIRMTTKRVLLIGGVMGLVLGTLQLIHLELVPDQFDNKVTLASMLRTNVAWPCDVYLREAYQVRIIDHGYNHGYVQLEPGLILRAEKITDDGMLIVHWADLEVEIPMDNTDFYFRATSRSSAWRP